MSKHLTHVPQDSGVTQTLPHRFCVSAPFTSGFAITGAFSVCPQDVTTLNSSVCIRDDTDIRQAFNIEVTTSMQLGFSNVQHVQSGVCMS